jgi:hypothetical protein
MNINTTVLTNVDVLTPSRRSCILKRGLGVKPKAM